MILEASGYPARAQEVHQWRDATYAKIREINARARSREVDGEIAEYRNAEYQRLASAIATELRDVGLANVNRNGSTHSASEFEASWLRVPHPAPDLQGLNVTTYPVLTERMVTTLLELNIAIANNTELYPADDTSGDEAPDEA